MNPRPKSTPLPPTHTREAAGSIHTSTRTEPPRTIPARTEQPYGIRRAVELLRRLPPGDRALLVEVVKMSLESAHVQVESIIDDANKRGAEIEVRVATLRREVTQREEEIATRQEEIANLTAEQEEINKVKEQLSTASEITEDPIADKEPSNDASQLAETSELEVIDDLGSTLNALELT